MKKDSSNGAWKHHLLPGIVLAVLLFLSSPARPQTQERGVAAGCANGKPFVEENLPPGPLSDSRALEEAVARRFPGLKLTRAEHRLLSAAASGGFAYGGTCMGDDPTNDPARAEDSWGPERSIRAELIRWLTVDPDIGKHIDPKGIRMVGARVQGALDLNDVQIHFPLSLTRSYFDQDIDLSFAEARSLNLAASRTKKIMARGIIVRDDVLLNQGFHADGEVNLVGAAINGNLECTDGTFLHQGKTALAAGGAHIGRTVLFTGRFHAEGQVNLANAELASDLYCQGGNFLNRGHRAFVLDGATIRRNLVLSDGSEVGKGFFVDGEVSLNQIDVGGDLESTGGYISNAGKTAISAVEAAVKRNIRFLRPFHSDGVMDFSFAKVGGDMDFAGTHFGDPAQHPAAADNGLIAESIEVAGTLNWSDIELDGNTKLDLHKAKVDVLKDDESSWPFGGKLKIDGFVYGSIDPDPADVHTRLQWLNRQSPADRLKPQPYQQLAQVFDELGRPQDAAAVRIAKDDVILEFGNIGKIERLSRWIGRVTVAYGYKPLRAVWFIVFLVIVGRFVFGWSYRAKVVMPTEQDAYRTFKESNRLPEGYQRFDPFLYSLDTFIPIVDLHQAQYWNPDPDSAHRFGGLVRAYHWSHRMLGRLLTALYAAGAGIWG